VSFAAITLFVASQRVFVAVVYFVMTQSGNFWIHPRVRVRQMGFRISAVLFVEVLPAFAEMKKEL
jgi:hypothetical protein